MCLLRSALSSRRLLLYLLLHTQKSNMAPPNYEVKLLMDPAKVLGPDFKLTSAVLAEFSMPKSVTKMNVQFLDTPEKEIYDAGWNLRIRKVEGKPDFELTYKKRYPISDGDIDAAVVIANNQDGFDADPDYEAQVEWGFQKQTLSISRDKKASGSGFSDTELPGKDKSREILIGKSPGKFEDWGGVENWGITALKLARIFGPVLAKRSIGTWKGTQLYIEVWPIKDEKGTGIEYVVEASFKTESRTEAAEKHDALVACLQAKDWFLAKDSLKTQLIMERY